jgi:hypothetical protein
MVTRLTLGMRTVMASPLKCTHVWRPVHLQHKHKHLKERVHILAKSGKRPKGRGYRLADTVLWITDNE